MRFLFFVLICYFFLVSNSFGQFHHHPCQPLCIPRTVKFLGHQILTKPKECFTMWNQLTTMRGKDLWIVIFPHWVLICDYMFCNHSVGRQLQTNIPINYSVNVVLKATRYSSFMLSCGVLFYRNKWPGNLSDLRTRILKQNQACGIQIIKPELLCAF